MAVSQINKNISDIKLIDYSLGTVTLNAQSDKFLTLDVSNEIPTGYRLLTILGHAVGDNGFAWNTFEIINNTTITVGINNIQTISDSGTVKVYLVCVK